MKGYLLLAEYASANPDGTITIVRAGIDQIQGPKTPIPFQGSLVARIVGDLGDAGSHVVEIRCMNADGKLAFPVMQGNLMIPPGGGSANLLFGLEVAFQETGKLVWVLRIDQVIAYELPIRIGILSANPGKKA